MSEQTVSPIGKSGILKFAISDVNPLSTLHCLNWQSVQLQLGSIGLSVCVTQGFREVVERRRSLILL
jgi:hypothetical protein